MPTDDSKEGDGQGNGYREHDLAPGEHGENKKKMELKKKREESPTNTQRKKGDHRKKRYRASC